LISGNLLYEWAEQLFPLSRSLSGSGVRSTLEFLSSKVNSMTVQEIPSGTEAFDWVVPQEWEVSQAYIEDMQSNRLVDWKQNNLHLVGYSTPINAVIEKEELLRHLHFLDGQPDAIPYVTSYYEKQWGFCLSKNQLDQIGSGPFKVVIDSKHFDGVLNYGEIVIPGNSEEEILFSTYICHPSMANNELSGPVIATAIAHWLENLNPRRYTYRLLFLPETIGSLYYLSRNLETLKKNVKAGYVLTCLGDSAMFSYIPSRLGNTLADRVAKCALEENGQFKSYSWLDRGSDERQYCAPGVDLPVCSVTRSKYHEYLEYHTSLDNLDFISPDALEGSLDLFRSIVLILENNSKPVVATLGEPQLGKRGLYPNLSTKNAWSEIADLMNIISFCDGNHDMIDIASKCRIPISKVMENIHTLTQHGLVRQ
jgi:aminopeptidase-like protein